MNGKILNVQKIAQDVGVDHSTVQNYFEILEDTLVGFLLEPFHRSLRKRQRQSAKFYYFDLGVTRALNKTLTIPPTEGTYDYGASFEHFLILEIKRLRDYLQPDWSLSYLRTKDDAEIDLILERPGMKTVAIEIKSSRNVQSRVDNLNSGFTQLAQDLPNSEAYLLSQDPIEQKANGIWCLPWQKGLREIGLLA